MYRVQKQCAIIHWLLNSPALECEFARGARSQDKSVRVAAVPMAGHAPVACDTVPAARLASYPRGLPQPSWGKQHLRHRDVSSLNTVSKPRGRR